MGKAKRITVSRLSRGAAIGGALAFLTCSVAVGARPAAAQSSLDPVAHSNHMRTIVLREVKILQLGVHLHE